MGGRTGHSIRPESQGPEPPINSPVTDAQHPLPPSSSARRARLAIEFLAIYFGAPTLFFTLGLSGSLLIPALILSSLFCLAILLRDNRFDRRTLLNPRQLRQRLPAITLRFALAAVLITVALLLFEPDRFLEFPRRRTGLWLLIMFGYPLVSVYPQEIIFRAFLFHRYAPIFSTPLLAISASATAFGYGHIIFDNTLAIVLTLVGGVLFALTYHRSRSLLAASLEHALYGMLIFTIGLGTYFYAGAAKPDPATTPPAQPPGAVSSLPLPAEMTSPR